MSLDFSPDRWRRIRDRYRRWWAGDLDRPLIHMVLGGRDPGRPEPELPSRGFASFYGLDRPAEDVVDRWFYDLECKSYAGDAFPSVWPNFGPGVIAALMGLELVNGDAEGTVWFHCGDVRDPSDIHFACDPGNAWYRRLCDLYEAAAARFDGLAHIGMTDLGGNLDILSSFRPGEGLLLDLYDQPDEVKRLTWEAHAMWWRYYEEFSRLAQAVHPGYTAWMPIYSEAPYYMLQCDFAYMIGPDMFNEFVKPELAASCRRLSNAFYHLDGPGQLPHLDSLLAIPELKGVQWVPGAGQPDITEWPEVYRKIHDAGKLIQTWVSRDAEGRWSLDTIAEQIGTAEGIIAFGSAPVEQEDDVLALLDRYGVPRE
jgi:hypothetical protein